MMYVHASKKLLVLTGKKRKLEQYKVLLPGTQLRWIEQKRKWWLLVPHTVEHCMMLKNLDARLKVPSPIQYYYDWPRSYKITQPFVAQKETAAFLTLNPRAHVHNSLGTGKSLAALWAWDYLNREGLAQRLLVVAPLSTIERTWADAVFDNFTATRSAVVLYGTRQRRLQLLDMEADVYIINHDGLTVAGMLDALAKRPDIDTIVFDELSQAARNATTARWKAFNQLANRQNINRRVWGLTGTPIPNAPTDAYAQAKLITPDKMRGVTYVRFRGQVMYQTGPFTWVPRPNATDTVFELLQPSIRFTMESCTDLPATLYSYRHAQLSPKQQRAYEEMLKRLVAEFDNNGEITTVSAVNEAVKLSKLIQIACGAVYDQDGRVIDVEGTERMEIVQEIVDEAEGKVIVFCPFRSVLAKLADFLKAPSAIIHGSVSKTNRDEIFQAFQNGSHLRVLIAQPSTMSHGLTLTAANTIVWFAPVTSADTYTQANGRIARPGQTRTTHVIHIEGTPAERRLYSRLEKKQQIQGLLLQLVEESSK